MMGTAVATPLILLINIATTSWPSVYDIKTYIYHHYSVPLVVQLIFTILDFIDSIDFTFLMQNWFRKVCVTAGFLCHYSPYIATMFLSHSRQFSCSIVLCHCATNWVDLVTLTDRMTNRLTDRQAALHYPGTICNIHWPQ